MDKSFSSDDGWTSVEPPEPPKKSRMKNNAFNLVVDGLSRSKSSVSIYSRQATNPNICSVSVDELWITTAASHSLLRRPIRHPTTDSVGITVYRPLHLSQPRQVTLPLKSPMHNSITIHNKARKIINHFSNLLRLPPKYLFPNSQTCISLLAKYLYLLLLLLLLLLKDSKVSNRANTTFRTLRRRRRDGSIAHSWRG